MVENLLIAAVAIAVVVFFVRRAKSGATASSASGAGGGRAEKAEALFVSMFPDLQPHFHPEKLVAYVTARRGRRPPSGRHAWKDAPGFAVASVDIRMEKGREECALVDEQGARLAQFRYEEQPEGGVLRLGAGKFTVTLAKAGDPAVRYWHPEREFKWTRRGGWRFKTPVADRPFESSDSGTSFSSSSSDGTSRTATAAAAGAAVVGMGGTFDGGGASAGWDGPAAGEPGSEGASTDSGVAAGESGSASSDGAADGSTSY